MNIKQLIKRLRDFPAAYLIIILGFVFLTGFNIEERKDLQNPGQPLEERAAQDSLPKAKDDLWSNFSKCKINLIEDKKADIYTYGITYTPEVKAMEGKEISIRGFMLPLEATEKFKHFILSKRTPTCAFCPPGQPNEIIDVWTDKPVEWNENIVKVTGKLQFIENKQLGVFFKIKDAKLN